MLLWTFVIGVLYAAGLYMVLRRSIVKIIIGLALLGHAANLLIFTAAGLTREAPPLIAPGDDRARAAVCRPAAAGAGPDRHRHRLWRQAFALVLFKRAVPGRRGGRRRRS